jgi:UDP-3-O-[3-hydroxymyristoyl] N-acetylglucosamine deacetylase
MANQEFQYLRVQQTVTLPAAFVGIGRRTDRRITMQVLPAEADHGIRFVRCDLDDGENRFDVVWDRAQGDRYGVTLRNPHGHQIAEVEHLLAALLGLGIDNAEVVVDGPELPVMDGSALAYVSGLVRSGIVSTGVGRDVLVVRRTVRVEQGDNWAMLMPDFMPRLTLSITHREQGGGWQNLSFCMAPIPFTREIAPARACGSVGGAETLSGRFTDEYVRHQALDTIGDFALAGLALIGHYRSNGPGHAINNDLMRLLMADKENWQQVSGGDLLDGEVTGSAQSIMGIGVGTEDRYTGVNGAGLRERLGLRGIIGTGPDTGGRGEPD